MTKDERERLIEQLVGVWRPRDAEGHPVPHPAWHGLDASARSEAAVETERMRAIEAAIDSRGRTSTARAVMERAGIDPDRTPRLRQRDGADGVPDRTRLKTEEDPDG